MTRDDAETDLPLAAPPEKIRKPGRLAGRLYMDDELFKSADKDIEQMFADSKGFSTNDD